MSQKNILTASGFHGEAEIESLESKAVEVDALSKHEKEDIITALQVGRSPTFTQATQTLGEFQDYELSQNLFGLTDPLMVARARVALGLIQAKERSVSDSAVNQYAQLQTPAPDILVQRLNVGYELVEGGHRLAAAKQRGDSLIDIIDVTEILKMDWLAYLEGETTPSMPLASNQREPARANESEPAMSVFNLWAQGTKVVDETGNPLVVYHGTTHHFDDFLPGSYFTQDPDEAGAYSSYDDVERRDKMAGKYTAIADGGKLDGQIIEYVGAGLSEKANPRVGENYASDQGVAQYWGRGKWGLYTDLLVDYENWPEGHYESYVRTGDASEEVARTISEYDEFVLERTPDGDKNGHIVPAYLSIKNPIELGPLEGNRLGLRLGGTREENERIIAKYEAQGYDGIMTTSDDAALFMGETVRQWVVFRPDQVKSAFDKEGAYRVEQLKLSDPKVKSNIDEGMCVTQDEQSKANFDQWFSGSKIVNESGAPKVVYHGTANVFDEFSESHYTKRYGIYFTSDPDFASSYGEDAADWIDYGSDEVAQGPSVIPAYLSLKNPVDVRNGWPAEVAKKLDDVVSYEWLTSWPASDFWNALDGELGAAIKQALERHGYDGVIATEVGHPVYVAFQPEQIRFALSEGRMNTESQADTAQVAANDFDQWFDGSKLIDKQGRPLVLFHGARPGVEIEEFWMPSSPSDGIYFTPDPTYAQSFTIDLFGESEGALGAIYPVYLNMRNPYIVYTEDGSDEFDDFVYRALDRQELQAQGYDGALLYVEGFGLDQAIAFDPGQVRFAVGAHPIEFSRERFKDLLPGRITQGDQNHVEPIQEHTEFQRLVEFARTLKGTGAQQVESLCEGSITLESDEIAEAIKVERPRFA